MNKRGQTISVYVVGEFILIAILILIFSSLMGQSSNPLLIEKSVTAEDVARTMEIAQDTPYDFIYEYPESLDGYMVNVNGYSVNLVADGEEPAETDFSFDKRYFTVRDGIKIPKEQEVDVAYFYIKKTGDEIRLGDKTSKEPELFEVTTKEKPNITVEFEKSGNLGLDTTLEKLSTVVKEEMRKNFAVDDSKVLTVKISSHESATNQNNIIYYSTAGEEDTKAIAQNLQKILEKEIDLLVVPVSKNYGQEKAIELDIADSTENKKALGEEDYKRKIGYLISYSMNIYYGVGQ